MSGGYMFAYTPEDELPRCKNCSWWGYIHMPGGRIEVLDEVPNPCRLASEVEAPLFANCDECGGSDGAYLLTDADFGCVAFLPRADDE